MYFAPASKKIGLVQCEIAFSPLLSERLQTCFEFPRWPHSKNLSEGTKNKACMDVQRVFFFLPALVHLQCLAPWNKIIVVCCGWYGVFISLLVSYNKGTVLIRLSVVLFIFLTDWKKKREISQFYWCMYFLRNVFALIYTVLY